jgi:hypothetical protein
MRQQLRARDSGPYAQVATLDPPSSVEWVPRLSIGGNKGVSGANTATITGASFGTLDVSAKPSDSTGAAAHPDEVDEAAPDETHASIHVSNLATTIAGCQCIVRSITNFPTGQVE